MNTRAVGAKHVHEELIPHQSDLLSWATNYPLAGFGCGNELFVSRFRRERGDELLETRMTAQRIPERMQTKFAVIQITRDL